MAAESDRGTPGGVDGALADLDRRHPAPVRRYPMVVYVLLTIATVFWLLVQGAAGIRQTDQPYPVTGFAMFSHPSSGVRVEFALEATPSTG